VGEVEINMSSRRILIGSRPRTVRERPIPLAVSGVCMAGGAVLTNDVGCGGYEIRTREGLPPTRFPSLVTVFGGLFVVVHQRPGLC
jgi:hypothetical protein